MHVIAKAVHVIAKVCTQFCQACTQFETLLFFYSYFLNSITQQGIIVTNIENSGTSNYEQEEQRSPFCLSPPSPTPSTDDDEESSVGSIIEEDDTRTNESSPTEDFRNAPPPLTQNTQDTVNNLLNFSTTSIPSSAEYNVGSPSTTTNSSM